MAKIFILSQKERGVAEPWKEVDCQAGISCLLDSSIEEAKRDDAEKPDLLRFFDRGPVDSIMYFFHRGTEPDKKVIDYTDKALQQGLFQPTVFLLEALPADKFESTDYCPEAPEESARISAWIERGYADLGFSIIKVPPCSVEGRVSFIFLRIFELESQRRL